LNFIYTGRIQIEADKVENLLKVADMFDIQEVREACTDTLIRNLCPENCISECIQIVRDFIKRSRCSYHLLSPF
jgi:hypothetical protein